MTEQQVLPIQAAIVGHTNVGKTSLIRTLTKNSHFGEVSSNPGTTRHVESQVLMADGEKILRLLDTPGFEDSISLFDLIDRHYGSRQLIGPEQLNQFLQSNEAEREFAQEAKVIRQLLQCDLIIYVIDVREPTLGKYQDELRIISLSGKPIFPLLNFIAASNNRLSEWTQLLANLNLHATVAFDSVVYNHSAEQLLYKKIQTLLEQWHQPIERLLHSRQSDWENLQASAAKQIASLLIDAAAVRQISSPDSPLAVNAKQLQDTLRQKENATANSLLTLFQFQADDYGADELPVTDSHWKMDLFDIDTLKQFGVKASSSAATGAAIGLGVDAAVGGMSLGAAAAIGGLLGGAWQLGKQFGKEAVNFVRGQRYLCADDETLDLLWLRSNELVNALQHRGHASQQQLYQNNESTEKNRNLAVRKISRLAHTARNHPDWENPYDNNLEKLAAVEKLTAVIIENWTTES